MDAGHGPHTAGKRTPKFKDGTFMHEHEFNSAVVKLLKDKLTSTGNFSVAVTSSDSIDVPLTRRVELEKSIRSDLFISVHANALSNVWGSPRGIESFYNNGSVKGKQYCNVIQDGLIDSTGLVDRGAKSAPGPKYPTSLYVLKHTYGPAVLIECGFMDNVEEALLLMNDNYRKLIANSLFRSICKIFKVEEGYKIVNKPTTTVNQMRQWAKDRNADPSFVEVAHAFHKLAVAKGCDPAVVYAQSAKETGFFKFGGVINKSYHNTCGLKISSGGGNYDPNAHMKFDTWEDGISAHIDHLLLYAGAEGYPNPNTLDPRHFAWIKGKAPTVEELSGNWAPSDTYGQSIVEHYIKPMLATEVVETNYKAMYEDTKSQLNEANKKLTDIDDILRR